MKNNNRDAVILKDKIEHIIYDWVALHFGESEAADPSWNIEALAEELSEKITDSNYVPAHKKIEYVTT